MSVTGAEGEHLQLRRLRPEDVGTTYVGWLNDAETVRYTEARHGRHTLESVREFVAACQARSDVHLWGIFELAGGAHVGNIKLGPIDAFHRRASIGLLIGERSRWGRGYATEAIGIAVRLGFGELGLHKLTAGVIAGNEPSLKAFRKNGFVVEGVRRRHSLVDGAWRDETLLGLLAEELAGA